MSRIFLSYRREQSADAAFRLRHELAAHFGKSSIFIDAEIQPGTRFTDVIDQALSDSDVVLAIIGRDWARRRWISWRWTARLNGRDDVLLHELEFALSKGKKIIPVLIHGSPMPLKKDLPTSLHPLLEYQGFWVASGLSFHDDVERLIGAIEAIRAHATEGMPDTNVRASATISASTREEQPTSREAPNTLSPLAFAPALTRLEVFRPWFRRSLESSKAVARRPIVVPLAVFMLLLVVVWFVIPGADHSSSPSSTAPEPEAETETAQSIQLSISGAPSAAGAEVTLYGPVGSKKLELPALLQLDANAEYRLWVTKDGYAPLWQPLHYAPDAHPEPVVIDLEKIVSPPPDSTTNPNELKPPRRSNLRRPRLPDPPQLPLEVGGTLSDRAIDQVTPLIHQAIVQQLDAVRACYDRTPSSTLDPTAVLTVVFAIQPDGHVAWATDGSGIKQRIVRCLAGIVSSIHFPQVEEEAIVFYHFGPGRP